MTLPSSTVEASTRVASSLHVPASLSFSLDETTTTTATRWGKIEEEI